MMKRVFGRFQVLVMFVGLVFITGCGGSSNPNLPQNKTASVTLANTDSIATITKKNSEILTATVDDTNTSIKKIVLSKKSNIKIANDKEILFIPSGVDDRFPLGYAGKIIEKRQRSDGSTEIKLGRASLDQIIDAAKSPEKTYDLSTMKLVGAIIPDIVSAGNSKTGKIARNAQVFGGGAVVHEPRSSFLGAKEVFTQGKINLNYKINLNKIADTSENATAIADLNLNISGSLNNLKITESHDIDFTYDLKKIVDVDVQQKFICEGDFNAEIFLKGNGSFKVGYVNDVWKDVEKKAFEKFGISLDFTGLNGLDKVGKIPLTGLVFNAGTHGTGNLNKDVKKAQVGGIVVWVYYNMLGEISVDGSVGMGVYPHFKFGVDKVKGGDAKLISELTPQKNKRIIEAPFISGGVTYKLSKGLSIEADAFVSGVRIINAGMDIKMDLQQTYKTKKRVSYGVTNLGDEWSWSDGVICQDGSIGAGAIFHADIAAGIAYEKSKSSAKLGWEAHPQFPTKSNLKRAFESKESGWIGTWYNFVSKRECRNVSNPSAVVNQHISNHRISINTDTLKQVSDENYLYAYLSNRIYAARNSDIDKLKDGWILRKLTNNKLNGFKAGLYQQENTNQYIVSYAGTQGTTSDGLLGKTYDTVVDLLVDVTLFSNNYFKPDQAKDAISFFQESQSKVGSGHIATITGHSLGGGLAQYAGLYSGVDTVTFNSAPLPYTTDTFKDFFPTGLVEIAGKNSDGELTRIAFKHKDKIKNIMLPYDPISTMSTALMALDEANSPFSLSSKWLLFVKDELKLDFLITGEQIYLPTPNQGGLFNFSNHSIDLVQEILQQNTSYALSFTTRFDGTKLIIESLQTSNDMQSIQPLAYRWKIYQNGTLIKSGEGIDNISDLADGNYNIVLSALLPNAMWVENHQSFEVQTQTNIPLLAKAGADQTVTIGTSVTLDASASSGNSISYAWCKVLASGSCTATLHSEAIWNFTLDTVGVYTYRLTVTDDTGSSSDDVEVRYVEASTSKLLKTGQTTSYTTFDDGDYQKGIARSYTRANNIVTDKNTKLMWQDDADAQTVTKPWVTQANWDAGNYTDTSGDTASTYCQALTLGGFTDWRLPSRKELVSLSDYGRSNPAIDPVFENVASTYYWSSTTRADYTGNAWYVYFYNGYQGDNSKYNNYHVRCVRAGQ